MASFDPQIPVAPPTSLRLDAMQRELDCWLPDHRFVPVHPGSRPATRIVRLAVPARMASPTTALGPTPIPSAPGSKLSGSFVAVSTARHARTWAVPRDNSLRIFNAGLVIVNHPALTHSDPSTSSSTPSLDRGRRAWQESLGRLNKKGSRDIGQMGRHDDSK
jgi:hypothetical protein